MQENCTEEALAKGAKFRCAGVMELKKIPYGKASHWGGTCARYIMQDELLAHLPQGRDSRGRVPLKVVLNIRPERAKRLGLGLKKKSWVLVEVYAINAAQATVFGRLSKYLPHGTLGGWARGTSTAGSMRAPIDQRPSLAYNQGASTERRMS